MWANIIIITSMKFIISIHPWPFQWPQKYGVIYCVRYSIALSVGPFSSIARIPVALSVCPFSSIARIPVALSVGPFSSIARKAVAWTVGPRHGGVSGRALVCGACKSCWRPGFESRVKRASQFKKVSDRSVNHRALFPTFCGLSHSRMYLTTA